MARLTVCPSCACHSEPHETSCPHCGAELVRTKGALPRTPAAMILGLAVAFSPTLAACGDDTGGGGDGGSGGTGGSGGATASATSTSTTNASTTASTTASTSDTGVGGTVQSEYGAAPTTTAVGVGGTAQSDYGAAPTGGA